MADGGDDIHMVGGKFTFSEDAQKVVHTFKKPKPKLSEMEGSLPAVDWTNRKKPEISNVWDEETAEELAKYIAWHQRHPHCVTPRRADDNTKHTVGKKMVDEEIPGTYYSDNGIKIKPVKKEFLPSTVGVNGDTDEVSSVALRTEYSSYIQNGYEDDDPWFIMSVKDHLEQSHMDGSHTTVKSKPVKNRREMSQFQQDMAWQKLQYGEYTGGGPTMSSEHLALIDKLALTDKSLLGKPKVKISPWQETHVYSKFTANGTALEAYNKKDLEDRIKVALAIHHNPYVDDKSGKYSDGGSSRASSRQSSRPSSRHRAMSSSKRSLSRLSNKSNPASPSSSRPSSKISKRKSKKIQVIPVKDQYDIMQEKLGGNEQLQKIEKNILKLAKKVTKKAQQKKALVDTSINLVEACDKLRVLKVTTLLITGKGKADMLTPDEETLFLFCFQKAIKMDNVTSFLKVGDQSQDSSDRKKLQKILDLLLKYGAKINSMKSKDGVAAVHMAALADNAKLLDWLIKNNANLAVLTPTVELLTPLMIAAKFGNVNVIVRIIESGFDINHKNPNGKTALHIAAMFGQTRTAIFLLRIGANKSLQDNETKTAADLATKFNFYSTAQAIAAFSLDKNRYKVQMDYMISEFESTQKRSQTALERLANNSLFSNFFNADPASFLSAKTWIKTFKQVKEQAKKKWKKMKFNPFKSAEQYDDEDDEEGDYDLDEIEEIARQQLLADNPELAEQMKQEEGMNGSNENSNEMFDDQSFGSLQDGDQVFPIDDS